ncbi:hypothetical protein [Fodinicola acaciae]|uniref:hypothetical protein n=1 Tax=Fodinicola acaciae TaxID=2681555 RepID=UPI0013D5BE79|nr:hypothetical protein [Fodinicola acaciae]
MSSKPESTPEPTSEHDADQPAPPMNRAERRAQKKGKQVNHSQVPSHIQARGSQNTQGAPRSYSSRRAG